MKLVECVPNISEGRDKKIIEAVADAARAAGAAVLDIDPGEATNRTVITLVGAPDVIAEAAFALVKRASELIDMSKHKGEHPRFGATDVCPFIPVQDVTMEECAEIARSVGKRIGAELGIPVYCYEEAASTPERRSLAYVRKGEYEGLPEKLQDPKMKPDFGPQEMNEKSGAIAVGARPFLIAYNINLNTKNKQLATKVAVRLRESGYKKRDERGKFVYDEDGNPVMMPGRFTHVRAIGWYVDDFGIAQISINLTNCEITPMHEVFDEAVKVAEMWGARVTGSEIVGLVPKKAMLEAGRHYLKKQKGTTGAPEKDIIFTAIKSLGLSELYEFKPEEKIIEERVKDILPLGSLSVAGFVDELSRNSPAPGGGSVAALAGALAGGLCSMVSALSFAKKKDLRDKFEVYGEKAQALQKQLLQAVDDDTSAFDAVMSAMRLKPENEAQEKEKRKALLKGYETAIRVPLETAEACLEVLQLADEVSEIGLESAFSDGAVASQMAYAGVQGGVFNVLINLPEAKELLRDGDGDEQTFFTATESRTRELLKAAEEVAGRVRERALGRLQKR